MLAMAQDRQVQPNIESLHAAARRGLILRPQIHKPGRRGDGYLTSYDEKYRKKYAGEEEAGA